jgi:hypothetical protein
MPLVRLAREPQAGRRARRELLLAAGLAWAFAFPACADTFLLKDGTQQEGTAVEDGEVLVITTYAGQVVRVPKANVVGSRKEPQRNEYYARAAKLKANDAAGQYELGLWAQQQRLAVEARAAFLRALQADPGHDAAGKALGYVKRDGRYVAAEEEGLTIAPAKSAKSEPRAEGDEAKKLAARLTALGAGEVDYQKNADAAALVGLAREQLAVFTRVLKAPGLQGSANIADGLARARAAQVLGVSGDRRALQPLLDACFEDPDDRVRLAAAKALPGLEEPVALRKLADVAIAARNPWPVRRAACAALRRYGDREAVERLLAELSFELAGGNPRDQKNPLRGGAHGLGTDNPMGLPGDQPPLGPVDEHILYPVLVAVKEVTGASFAEGEKDFKTWREWWKANAATFKFKD